MEIKRRKFGRKAWKTYLRVTAWSAAALAGAWMAYVIGHFLLASPEMALVHPDQVVLTGSHYVPRNSVIEIFAGDRGKSVLRIPLDQRRRQLESIPWVEQATVRRALPNQIEVEITERTPVAFLRDGSDMALVDVHGTILERPIEGEFHFPVVTGIRADMPQEDREGRMQLFSGFTQQIESVHADAIDRVSEVDLSDEQDVRATLTALQSAGVAGGASSEAWGQADAPVLVHFGSSDFAEKYRTLVEHIGEWRATAGHVESIDLRFSRQAVVNPEPTEAAAEHPSKPAAKPAAKTAPRPAAKKPAKHSR
ncbi:MAG: FtsQ-type POTRA domain-containing protein [Acidobacteriia bacterium]|nr:FtsQ-type POTRA domain-containing protein [Terriglobia bacterium]